MASTWFDFTDLSERVAELNRLNKAVGDLSDIRWRTRAPEDIARWKEAVDRWYAYSGFGRATLKFYIFENHAFLDALASGDAEARRCAITFLEHDPYYFRSGYMKGKLLVRLKHLALTPEETARLQEVVCRAIFCPRPKCEFKYYARLMKKIGTAPFRRRLAELPVPDVPWLKARRERCLWPVYKKDAP